MFLKRLKPAMTVSTSVELVNQLGLIRGWLCIELDDMEMLPRDMGAMLTAIRVAYW